MNELINASLDLQNQKRNNPELMYNKSIKLCAHLYRRVHGVGTSKLLDWMPLLLNWYFYNIWLDNTEFDTGVN